jgi:undecaprenyl pyrophosphate phosphatase UppP
VRSHFLHMVIYATIVSTFFGTLFRDNLKGRVRLGSILWLAMVGGALVLAYAMYPFPR